MPHRDTTTTQKYRDALRLFIETRGDNLTQLEREMHALGHTGFTRRSLYARHDGENGDRRRPGWIERYGWKELLDADGMSEPPCVSGRVLRSAVERPPEGGTQNSPERSLEGRFTPALRPASVAGTAGGTARCSPRSSAPHSALRTPHSFKAWLRRVSPNMEWDLPHQEYLYSHLQRVTDGTCKRLMVFMPPRHGKSETVTVRYTAWRISQDPSTNVILGSYNQRLADRFSRKVRRVLADDAAVSLKEAQSAGNDVQSAGNDVQSAGFSPSAGEATAAASGEEPHNQPKDTARRRDLVNGTYCPAQQRAEARTLNTFTQKPANSVSEWETTEGGTFRAVGVGAGVTGFGAKLIVVDDPVKSRAEAESETYRDKVYEWFTDDLYTRLEPTVRSSSSKRDGTRTTSPAA